MQNPLAYRLRPQPRAAAHALHALLIVLGSAAPAFAQELPGASADTELQAQELAPAPTEAPPADDAPANASARALVVVDAAPPTLQVGAPQAMRVRVTLPSTGQFVTLRPSGNRFVEPAGDVTQAEDGSYLLPLVVFRSGTYALDGVELLWINDVGAEERALSEPVTLVVESVIANENDPSLAPPGDWIALRSWNTWLIAGLVGAALALLALLGVQWARRRRQSELPAEDLTPPRPAWEVAIEALDALEEDQLLEQEQHLDFHYRLSEIVRTWIEGRYGVNAMEMTTREISSQLAIQRLSMGHSVDAMEQILDDTDFVKFARFTPPVDGSRKLLAQARELVLEVQRQDLAGPASIPEPLESVPEPPPVDAVSASPQPQTPGAPPVHRASQEPLPENVITLGSIRRDASKKEDPR